MRGQAFELESRELRVTGGGSSFGFGLLRVFGGFSKRCWVKAHLHRLAEAHFVGQDARPALVVAPQDPVQAVQLVRPQHVCGGARLMDAADPPILSITTSSPSSHPRRKAKSICRGRAERYCTTTRRTSGSLQTSPCFCRVLSSVVN